MLVSSEHLGEIEVDESTVLDVPAGLLGFPDATRYVLVDADESGAYTWLQSVDEPALAFLGALPWPFFPDYEPELSEEDRLALGVADPAEAQVICLLTITDEGVTANLLGPIVINVVTRKARQVVLADSAYTTREPLG